jgi:hypothetical protein
VDPGAAGLSHSERADTLAGDKCTGMHGSRLACRDGLLSRGRRPGRAVPAALAEGGRSMAGELDEDERSGALSVMAVAVAELAG